MAQRTLRADVVLGGRVDNTFGQIGTSLTALGTQVDKVSQQLINFGKESMEVYRSYEDSMLEAEGALATVYGRGSVALKGVMADLDEAAKHWASTTIFHTDDVANAINEAAHANWNLDQIMTGMPAVMKLAQAGGLDLSQALDYVITSTNAAGIGFDDLTEWIDVWAFAANSSAGTIVEFGDAMQRMGNTMKFADSKEELMTLLAVLHNAGTKGAAAGTLLRNSMIRLVAPTKNATDAMQALGVTEDDVNEAMGESAGDLDAATESLRRVGFSAYDEQGNLKGFIEIFTDLNKAVSGMTEEERNNVLSSIFPTRTITGALAFLDSAANGFDGLYAAMEAGDAAGYGEYLSALMMSGVTGSTETLLSKVENLKLLVGEELAPYVQNIQEWVGTIVDDIAGMDDGKFGAIVNGLKTVAIAGPGLLVTGAALKFIGLLLGPAGAIALGTIALGALVGYLHEMEEVKFEDQFGDMPLDMATLNEYIKTLGTDFDTAFRHVSDFAGALQTATDNYTTASSTFSSELLNATLIQTELTPEQKTSLENLGIQAYNEVIKAVNASSDMAAAFWLQMYGEDEAPTDPRFAAILDTLTQGRDEQIARAEAIQQNIHDALMKGYEEGFTNEDYSTILGYYREYNEIVAEAQNEAMAEEAFVQQEKWLRQAQTASLEDIKTLAETVTSQRDAQTASLEDMYLGERSRLKWLYKKQGYSDEEAEAMVAATGVDEKYENWRMQTEANYDRFIMTLWETQARQSGLAEDYGKLEDYAGLYLSGAMDAETIMSILTEQMGGSEFAGEFFGSQTTNKAMLGKLLGMMVTTLGGPEELSKRIGFYEQAGQADMAAELRNILAMEQLALGFRVVDRTTKIPWDVLNWDGSFSTTVKGSIPNREMMDAMTADAYAGYVYTPEAAKAAVDTLGTGAAAYFEAIARGATAMEIEGARQDMGSAMGEAVDRIVDSLGMVYDLERAAGGNESSYSDYAAAWNLMNMSSEAAAAYLIGAAEELGPMEVGVAFPDAVSEAQQTHEQMAEQFTPIDQSVNIVVSGTYPGMINLPEKAKGGRETQPSIFAEAGIPEWFIPEEHTDNTARLIMAAARASGFSIYELAEMAGARLFAEGGTNGAALAWATLNTAAEAIGDGGGDYDGGGIQVQYSPVIHADNAQGLERVLMEDKKRMQRWFEEWWEKKGLYESMVRYGE